MSPEQLLKAQQSETLSPLFAELGMKRPLFGRNKKLEQATTALSSSRLNILSTAVHNPKLDGINCVAMVSNTHEYRPNQTGRDEGNPHNGFAIIVAGCFNMTDNGIAVPAVNSSHIRLLGENDTADQLDDGLQVVALDAAMDSETGGYTGLVGAVASIYDMAGDRLTVPQEEMVAELLDEPRLEAIVGLGDMPLDRRLRMVPYLACTAGHRQ